MKLKIIIPAIIACLLWSTAFAGIKIGLQYCNPLPFAGIRFILAGLLLVPLWIRKKNAFRRIIRNWKLVISVSVIQIYILYALMFWAMTYVSSTITAIVVGSSPLLTAVTTHYFTSNDKLNRYKLLSIIIGITGIIIITLHNWEISANGSTFFAGIIMLIIAMISSALGNILVSTRSSLISPLTLNSMQMIIGGIFLLITGLIVHGHFKLPINIEFYAALLWLSFLSAAAFSIWFVLLKTKDVKVSDLNVWKFIIPVFGAVFSWLIVPGEHSELITIIGMIIASFSILLYNLSGKKKLMSCHE